MILSTEARAGKSPGDGAHRRRVIAEAMVIKPRGHEFDRNAPPKIVRFMNRTGGGMPA